MPPRSRKRTRSTNISDDNNDHQQTTSRSTIVSSHSSNPAPPKRQRNNPSPVTRRSNYSLRNRSISPDSHQTSSEISTNSQRYNFRPRRPQSQVRLPQISSTHQNQSATTSIIQPRQYRFVYISDDDEQTTTTTQPSTTFNLITDQNDNDSQIPTRRTSRSTSNTRSRTINDSASSTTNSTTDNQDYSNNGVAHVRLNRAIEIVIDSLQSLEGAVNNFDQLVFGLIYGRLSTRTEMESIEGMIRLSRILNLNFPSRLTQDEIDALPKIKFLNKSESTSSILLIEKCPICLTEFHDQEIINKLNCTHLFHLECISTWLSENDSCPTCRRKVNGN